MKYKLMKKMCIVTSVLVIASMVWGCNYVINIDSTEKTDRNEYTDSEEYAEIGALGNADLENKPAQIEKEEIFESKNIEATELEINNNDSSNYVWDYEPFYGIWCQASKDYNEAWKCAEQLRTKGFAAQVFVTTDWSNLNKEHWYVVTADVYAAKEEANSALSSVQAHYKDAYVKYSGYYKGNGSTTEMNSNIAPNSKPNSTITAEANLPFYGIWCQASKDYNETLKYAEQWRAKGFDAQVFETTDWSNLNKEHWYAVSVDVYVTKEEANEALSSVQAYYKDAYVKYSGNYQGNVYIQDTNVVENGHYSVFISELSNGKLIYRNCYFITEVPQPLEEVYEISYSADLKIKILDPNQEYGPEVECVIATQDTFREMINTALAWNGYGFICNISVENGVVTEINEFYLP